MLHSRLQSLSYTQSGYDETRRDIYQVKCKTPDTTPDSAPRLICPGAKTSTTEANATFGEIHMNSN